MDEIVSGVQVIKMYAWEKPFTKLITMARKMEIKVLRRTLYIRAFHLTCALLTARMALFGTMIATVLIHGPEQILSARIFVISSYLTIVSQLMSSNFARCISECSEALVGIRRLQNFMQLEEQKLNVDSNMENGIGNAMANGSKQTVRWNLNIKFWFLKIKKIRIFSWKTKDSSTISSVVSISMKNLTACWMMPINDHESNGSGSY